MNEGTKTGIFWVVAGCMAAFATFVAWPRSNEETAVSMLVGKELFKEFTDPLAASSMKIVNFDAVLGQIESFEVAKDRQTGVWSIPSRQGYPADGSEQMQQAATALLGLKILDVKSENPEDHDDFGVVEPDLEKLSVGDDGVGRLVTVKNAEGKALVELVIGNEVADFPTHRYVRVPNQDPVYEIELDIDPLTTEFSRWIEDDLLQLSSIDVGATKIRKYSVAVNAGLRGIEVSQQRSYDADLTLDDTNQWSLENLLVYDNTNAGSMRTLQPGESLNTTALNKLKNALDDLKIVDVVRKPDGMSADLKADKSLVENDESLQSLVKKGFYPLTNSSGDGVDILANNGETIVDLKDGVQYILRFGGVAGIVSEDDQEEEGAEADVGAERYLLVTTRVNESQIPRPEVQPVPQTLEELAALRNPPAPAEPAAGLILPNPLAPASGEPAAAEEPTAEAPAPATVDEPTAEEPTAEEPAAVEEVPAEASGEGSSEASGEGEVRGGGQEPSQQPPAEEPPAEEPPAEEPPAEEPPAEEPPAEEPPAEEPAAEEPAAEEPAAEEPAAEEPAADEPAAQEPAAEEPPANEWDDLTPEEQQEYLQAEQEKIKKENQRLIDEWEEKIAAAQKRVSELNARFADWYYIVPESTYADLQIKLSDLIQQGDGSAAQPNQPPAGPAGLPQFNFSN